MLRRKVGSTVIHHVGFTLDGHLVTASNNELRVCVWQADLSGEPLLLAAPRQEYTWSGGDIMISADGRWLICFWQHCGLQVWDLTDPRLPDPEAARILPIPPTAHAFAVSPLGIFLISTSSGLRRFDLRTGQELSAIPADPTPAGRMAFSADGCWLVSARGESQPGRVRRDYAYRVWDAESGALVREFACNCYPLGGLAIHPDGRTVVALHGPYVRVWDRETGTERVPPRKVSTKHGQDLAFTPNGRHLLTVTSDPMVRVWDTESWEVVKTYVWKGSRFCGVAVSPDGLRAAACGGAGRLVVWDLDS